MVEEGEGCPTMEKKRNGERGKKNPNFHQSYPFYIADKVCHVI